MTKDFREAVERHIKDNPLTTCIDRQLESLFGDLKIYTAYTFKITNELGIKNVYEQQDAAEYFEKILAKTSDGASKIFHGQLTHKTICSSCRTETSAAGPFWHLPLALVDSDSQNYSMVTGIEDYFRESSLIGENQLYCEKCDGKSDATTKCVIEHPPEVLMLLLKRFEFDYYSMTYVKINCTVDVPCSLQIPENQTYELVAAVDHFGDLRSGHYIATIKSEDDGRWYSFNDSCVMLLDYQPFQSDKVEKSSSAYLLFYRKEKVPAAGTQDFGEESTPGGSPHSTCDTQDKSQTEKIKREEDEGKVEEGYDTAAAFSTDSDEGTGIKDRARVRSSISDIYNIEDQGNRGNARQRNDLNVQFNEEGNDLNAGKQREEGKLNMDALDDMRRNKDLRKSRDTPPEESVDDEHNDSGGVGDFIHGVCNRERNDLHAEKQRDEVIVNMGDEDDMRGSKEMRSSKDTLDVSLGLETPEESVDDQPNDSVRVGDVSHGYNPGVSEGHLKKQDESKAAQSRERDEKTDKTRQNEQSEEKSKSLRKHLYRDREHHESEGLRNVKPDNLEGQQNMWQAYGPSVDQKGEGWKTEIDVEVDMEGKTDPSRSRDSRQPREGRRDVKGALKQKKGNDKHEQRTETLMTKPYLWEGGEDQDKRRLDGVEQEHHQQQKTSAPHLTSKDDHEEGQATEQERKHFPNRADSFRSKRSRRQTKDGEDDSVEKMEIERKPKQLIVKIFEEETKETTFGKQTTSEASYFGIIPKEKNAQQESLSEGFSGIKLSDSTLPKPKKHESKRYKANSYQENVATSAMDLNAENMQKVSETQEQTAEKQLETVERGEKEMSRGQYGQEKENGNGKKKKTTSCFCKHRKRVHQSSKSD
ncbi:hypothetical protein PBY51_002829 [Eleginops maclovinus]|uniref:USP domain-containing protein n=2 Tax=Eleginops maclovinus TaxID=56733 RepID=A0AAN7X8Z5_ELEMC|nr:hypothetical protein PBY51_002829 [Eleginops maclovinus]